ncbi:MAG: GNAT family N-acetyltransferase, partial [Legionella sp.]
MIYSTHQLSTKQLQDVMALAECCKEQDGNAPDWYPHILKQYRRFPATLLYYHEEHLVGFLSLYFFYEQAVELSLFVHPAHRRQKIGQQLLQTIMPLMTQQAPKHIIFSVPGGCYPEWLAAKKATYLHSEYAMVRKDAAPIVLAQESPLSFRQATAGDWPAIQLLDDQCFPDKEGAYSAQLTDLFDDSEYQIILGLQAKKPIGKAHLRWQEGAVMLSDIAITPELQGRGLGSVLIAYCINEGLSLGAKAFYLDVETHNQRALDLYRRLGFVVKNACDFWSIE